jgi:hypothetical protein
LESLPEIQREEVLAGRLEEMQKYKDSQQLDAMLGMAGMGQGEDDEDDDDDGRGRKKREQFRNEVRHSSSGMHRETYERDEGGFEGDNRLEKAEKGER